MWGSMDTNVPVFVFVIGCHLPAALQHPMSHCSGCGWSPRCWGQGGDSFPNTLPSVIPGHPGDSQVVTETGTRSH